jgi:uncharacterized protein (DUF1015 family)
MLRINAFQGLRPRLDLVEEVAAVPYDVVNREESAALAEGKPYSLLHVDRAEIDLPPETDPYSDAVYAKAQENFLKLQSEGALIRETEPCIYLYQQRMGSHVQTGVAAVCHIDDYENDLIKKHEKTRPDKENDRTRLIDTLSADTGPVFLTYRDSREIHALVEQTRIDHAPLYDFTAPDGIQHIVWQIAAPKAYIEAFAKVPLSYVADGHHRTASAARVGRERRAKNPDHTGEEDYNWFLAVLFPGSELKILPYNRAVHDLNGHTEEAFLRTVSSVFQMKEEGTETPTKPGEISMYLHGLWYSLTWKPAADADPISQLDVTGLQERLLAPILGIDDPRTSKRIDFVGGIRGTDELEKLVNSGKAAVAFPCTPPRWSSSWPSPTPTRSCLPKSTWFEPKLRSGLFIHTF